MNTQVARKTLHELIDQIEDGELLSLYVKLLERELKKESYQDFFNTSDSDLIARWLIRFKLCHPFRFVSASDFGSNCASQIRQ